MVQYEIWGPNDDGDKTKLGESAGEIPNIGDIIDVDGKDWKLKDVIQRHFDGTSVTQVLVGQYDDDEPMPIVVG